MQKLIFVILSISVILIGFINNSNIAFATTPPKPFAFDLFYGYEKNQTALVNLFNQFTNQRDFIFPIVPNNNSYYKQVNTTNIVLNIGPMSHTQMIIAKAKTMNVTYLMYDLEPPSGAEFLNYVNSTATVANQVHAAGLKVVLTPRWSEIPSYGTKIAKYADLLTIQMPYPPNYNLTTNYQTFIMNYSLQLKHAAGHQLFIGEQLLTKSPHPPPTNSFDPKDIALEYNNTKQYINYIQFLYFNQTYTDNTNTTKTSDLIPYITKFYQEIGFIPKS